MSGHTLPSVPGYRQTTQLYAGNRTIVYRAISEHDGKSRVIKVLRSRSPRSQELVRFRNQYIIAKNLDSPGIVKPLALVPWHHSYALVMADVEGISLRQYLQTHALTVEQVLAIALQLADNLHYLNQERVLHKDINPGHILIHPDTHQIWLTGFSLASLLPKESQELQSPSSLEGTLAYIAPEQTGRMNRGIDYRADFYSLGVTLYELLTGQLPFPNDDPMELIHCHIAKPPPFPLSPSPLSNIVLKLMAKNAEDRYQSALGLKHDLQQCLDQWRQTGTMAEFDLGQRDVCDRFLISEKLYGREAEIQALLDAFQRVSQGSSELMLVAGFSGIGKTAVVNEIHKPITRQKGYFIKGKFDQFNRNIPFSAFFQALRSLMGQLLGESDTALADWKANILAAVGESGQVLIEVLPELEHIIGKQPAVPELSGSAAQNRFHLIFGKFIRVFTSPTHPLVIFLDDLQWIDSASLGLFKLLMDDESVHLLVLGAYRDNEVFPTHPLMQLLDEIQKLGATLNTLTLEPLKEGDIEHLVADTLHYSIALARPLSQLVHQKTQGNPFFATQFLQGLYSDGWITFNQETDAWQYDLPQVRQLALTDNVVALMVDRLRQLPTATQEVLKLSACIGNHFDLQTLAVVCECSPAEAAVNLWPSLQMGLIVPADNAYKFLQGDLENDDPTDDPTDATTDAIKISYRFLHDYVQQSTYALIPPDQKNQIHYHLGQLLTREISRESQETRIFELVTHLNHGAEYITDQNFRDDVAQLNLQACQKAKRTIAYQSGYGYATMGLSWLGSGAWERQYDLSLQLYNFAAEFAWLCGDLDTMDSHIKTILQQSQSLLDKIPAFCLRIQADTSQMQFADALITAQQVFELLGVVLPSTAPLKSVPTMVAEIAQLLSKTTISDLINLPVMEQPSDIAVIQIISQVIPAAYICGSPLFPVIVILGVRLLIRGGNSPLSAFIYANYAYILCNYCQEIEASEEFGQLALGLVNEPNAKSVRPQVYVMLALYMQHRKSPLRETLDLARQGYIFAQDVGNQEWAGYSAYAFCANGFASVQNLTDLEKTIQDYCVNLRKSSQIAPANWCQIYRQTILNLTNSSAQQQNILFSYPDQEADFLAGLHKAEDLLGLYHFHLCKLIISYLFGDIDSAHLHALEARARLDVAQGTVGLPVFYFYDSLVLLSQLTKVDVDSKERDKKLKQVEHNQNKLQQDWASYAPVNYQHKFNLVQAERLGVMGERWAALELYDIAIAEAKAHGYLQEEALANELAAKFYLGWNKEKVAAGYMQDAYYGYLHWNAKAKTNHLEQRYPHLLTSILQEPHFADPLETLESVAKFNLSVHSSSTSISSSINTQLDFSAVLKSAQLLSEKVQLDELLTELCQLMLKNSGADKLAIILPNYDNEWQVRAIATPETTQLLAEPFVDHSNLPIQLIQYTKNTQEIIAIDNLDTELSIIDAYLQGHQPRSILCLPILHQGNLKGLLYLQNQAISGVFSRERITVLNFLSTQAAISLINAQIYQQSQDNAQQLERSLSQLQASETRFRHMAANVPGVIYQFYMTANGATSVLYASPDCHVLYGVSAEAMMAGQYSFRDFVHSEDRPTIEQLAAESAQRLQSFDQTFRIITASGELKWVHAISHPSQHPNGAILWDGVIMDITERKTTELALKDAQDQFRRIAENVPGMIYRYILHPDGSDQEPYTSSQVREIFEVTPEDIAQNIDHIWERIHPDDIDQVKTELQVSAQNLQPYDIEYRLSLPHQRTRWVKDKARPERLDNGDVIWDGVLVDISDRKQAERLLADYNCELEQQVEERTRALQTSEERLRLALRAGNQGFYDLNLQTGETIVSPEYALMLGYDPATFRETADAWQSRIHLDDRQRSSQAYRAYEIGQATQYNVEFRMQTRQGDWKWILSMGQFMEWDAAGKPTRLLGTHTDISDRKFAEIQLSTQNDLLARIAQGQPLLDVLNTLIHHVEHSLDGALCSVLLLDKDDRLRHGASPSLPDAYNQAVDGVLIGEGVGACGTAAFRNQTVIVADITIDSLWSDYKDLALAHGLRASWSTPINARGGQVLGTFAMYYKQVKSPQTHELKTITQMAHIAGIAIERHQAEDQLRQSEATLLKAQQVAHVGNWEFDIASQTITWSPEMFRLYGLEPTASAPSYPDFLQMLPVKPRLHLQQYVERAIAEGIPYNFEYSRTRSDGSLCHQECRAEIERDDQGRAIRLLGTVLDITDLKQAELALQNLVTGTAATIGQDFFPALVHHISNALDVPIALVTQFVDQELQSLAFIVDGEPQQNFTYDLPETPCRDLVVDYSYHCPSGVSEHFPNNPMREKGVESYLGVALRDRQGQVLGSVCIFDRQPLQQPERAKQILEVFSGRAAAELERQRTEQAMEQLNHELEIRVLERTAQLAASEDRLQTLFNEAADAVFLTGEQGFIDCNQAAIDLLRYTSKEDLLALHPHQISPERQPDGQLSVAKMRFMLQEALQRCSFRFEWVHQRTDGENFWAEITLTPIRYQGDIIFHAIVRDISDRKQLEQEQARLTAVLEATPDFIGIANAQGEILWHNKPLRELRADLGQSGEHHSISACHPDWVNTIILNEALPTAMQQGSWSGELALLDGKGNEIPVSQVIIAHKSAAGEVESFSTVMRDIHAIKRTEAALKLSEARANAAFEQAAVGIAESNLTDGKVTRTNNYFCQMTGYTAQELEALTGGDLTHPDDISDSRENIKQLYTGQVNSFTLEKRYLRKDGSYFWASTAVTLIQNPVEDSPRCLAVVQDISDRKHYEQQLQDLSKRLELAIESAQIGIWEWNSEDNRLSWDQRMFEIYGVGPEEFKGTYQDWENRVHSEDLAQYEAGKLVRTQNSEKDYAQEFRIFRPDGTMRYLLATALIERDSQGQPIRMVGTNLDITGRKAIELALQESERRFASLTAAAPVAIFRFDAQCNCIYVNQRWSEMTGCPVESALGRGWLNTIHPEEVDSALAARGNLNHQNPLEFQILSPGESRILRSDGTIIWCYSNIVPEFDEAGNLTGYIGTLTDITERKEAELALQDAQAKFRRMTENVPGMIYRHVLHTDGNDELTYVNSQVREIFEVEPEAALDNVSSIWARIHSDDLPQIRKKVNASADTLEPFISEHRLILPKKGLRWIQIFSRPERLNNGDVIWDGVVIDISDRKQAEEQLQQTLAQLEVSNNELESFAYSVSHDLRAPLRAINGFSQALFEDYGHLFDQQAQDYFARIRSNTNRMGQLIDDLLQLSRLSRSELRYGTVDLSTLTQEILHDLQSSEPDRQVEIIVQPGAKVVADVALMQVVLINLLQNAWKFTRHHPTARIEFGILSPESSPSPDRTYFVKDDGAGFDMAYRHKLFGVFQRLHSPHEFPGTGIGLASVRRAIHRHGGQVWTEAAIEQGATIFFTIPNQPDDISFEVD